jgi:hypothetical protein
MKQVVSVTDNAGNVTDNGNVTDSAGNVTIKDIEKDTEKDIEKIIAHSFVPRQRVL